MNPFVDLKVSNPLDITFDIRDVDLSIVNALRRVILSEIDNVGFFFDPKDFSDENKDIEVIRNDTPLHNEFIQHRISLIPIHVNVKELESWDKDEFTFEIEKVNNTEAVIPIYTSHFTVLDKNNKLRPDLAERFFPADPITKDHILITKLNMKPDSRFHIRAKASLNPPKKYTSFGMVSTCAVEFVVDENIAKRELAKYLESNKDKMSVDELKHQFNSIERERHYQRNKFREPNLFRMRLVSECSIPCTYIVGKAIEVLKNKVLKFKNTEHDIINTDNLYTVIVRNETHTLGNTIQALCFNHYIRDGNEAERFGLKYIGYNVPHPLEDILLIKIKGDKVKDPTRVKEFLTYASDYVLSLLVDLENQWNTISKQ
jgi:DNA-directed RNA polymerase subunit L